MNRNQLISRLNERVLSEITNYQDIKVLKQHDSTEYIDTLITTVYMYTRPKKGNKQTTFAEVISAIGHSIRGKLGMSKNSVIAARIGAFMLYSFEEAKIIHVKMGAGSAGHQQLLVDLIDDDAIVKLWSTVTVEKSQKLPALKPFADWSTARHPENGALLVKTGNKDVINSLSIQTHPMVFESVNRAQKVGWRVYKRIFDIAKWALRSKAEAFADIWEQTNPEAKTTKLREAKAIIDIADKLSNNVFYHQYYLDFRGRKYPTSAYLHEQGSDLARSLLLRADSKKIGERGFRWLCISIASNWAGDSGRYGGAKTDKIPLDERVEWVLENEAELLLYGEKPKKHQGWMQADNPWQFLAACMELYRIRLWQAEELDFSNFDIESSLEVYIDGSNNGSQHLSALTLDDETAPHVNLVPLQLPGDLYKYVGSHVWETLDKELAKLHPLLIEQVNEFVDRVVWFRKQIAATEARSEQRKSMLEALKKYKTDNIDAEEHSALVFWSRIRDAKHIRKIVKRNTMTLPYGGTAYGLG